MEKFVTIFDFDQKKLGFAEPVNPVIRQSSYQQQSEQQAFVPANDGALPPSAPARQEPVAAPMFRSAAVTQPPTQTADHSAFPWASVLLVSGLGMALLLIGM